MSRASGRVPRDAAAVIIAALLAWVPRSSHGAAPEPTHVRFMRSVPEASRSASLCYRRSARATVYDETSADV